MENNRKNIARFCYLALQINSMIDDGKKISVDDILEKAENHKLISWFESELNIDISLWDEDDRKIMDVEFESIANCVDAERKLLVSNNGYCLLVAYCLSFIVSPPTRTLEDL